MAVKTKKYINKHGVITLESRAIKVTARNYISVAEWCGGEARDKTNKDGEIVNQRVAVRTPKGIRVARIGDYVALVRNEDGVKEFFAEANEWFESHMVLVK